MSRVSYVNGRYAPHAQALIHCEDRGLSFADGVYEVMEIRNRCVIDVAEHHQRLRRSLAEINLVLPMSDKALEAVYQQLIYRNHRQHSLLYLQVTRGIALRDHAFPKQAKPSVVATILPDRRPSVEVSKKGVKLLSMPDERWGRCDIKSISLLPNVLAKQKAAQAGAKEALLLAEDGTVREGSASNFFIITQKGELWTHPADAHILPGITRVHILALAKEQGITVKETHFTMQDVYKAAEAFISSTSMHVMPISHVDEKPIGTGKAGPVSMQLLQAYRETYLNEHWQEAV